MNNGSSGQVTTLPAASWTTPPPPMMDRFRWFCSQACTNPRLTLASLPRAVHSQDDVRANPAGDLRRGQDAHRAVRGHAGPAACGRPRRPRHPGRPAAGRGRPRRGRARGHGPRPPGRAGPELGQAGLLVAGGMESMSNAPYLVPKARLGARMGDAELVDAMVHDGLWDAFDDAHMGGLSDETNRRLGIDRAAQDEWAARSHERAAEATKNGVLAEEITPVVVAQRKGEVTVDQDEGIRPGTTAEALGRLRPAFSPEGTITAGNASQISDGAAAVVVTSRERAAAEGLPVLASVVAYGTVAGPDTSLHSQPSRAIADACRRAGVAPGDLDLVEINEAFAAVALRSTRELELDEGIVNVNGGAVALGHPIGASGTRVVLTLAMELRRRGGGLGAAALCGGGGQGDALLVRVEA